MSGGGHRLFDRVPIADEKYLNYQNAPEFPSQRVVSAFFHGVDKLNGVDASSFLLLDDGLSGCLAGKQKSGETGRHSSDDFSDELFVDRSRAAWHFRDESKRRSSEIDGRPRLFNARDAADF